MTNKNQISVHQAFYGEVNRSHGCLFSTVEDAELKTFLTGFTDRPSAVPAGITMHPYYSAIAHGRYYVFSLTFPDHTALRAGMVFTHVLIIGIDDIEYVNNLDYLFSHFCKTIPENKTSIQELIIPISSLEVNEAFNTFPEYVIQGARELANGKLPLSFCGTSESFIRLITSVWVGLPYSFRTKMSFTAGFSTANMDTSKTFIHFQKNLEDSLRNSEFVSDMDNSLGEVDSTVEKYILTPLSDNQFEVFIKKLNVDLKDWSILQLCAKAYEGYQNYLELSNDALKQLMRQLAKISPNKNDGKSIKTKVVSEIKQRIDVAQETNLKSLKNLPLDAFDSGEDVLADSVNSSAETELIKENEFHDELMSEVIILSYKEAHANWWHTAIKSALKNSIRGERVTSIQNIWKLLIRSEDSVSAVLSFFPEDRKYEHLLIKHIPQSVPQNIAESFAKAIQKRKWLLLHAHLIRTYLTPKEALKQQLSLEKKLTLDSSEGSKLIAKGVTDKDLISLAMETNEKFFIAEYAVRSVESPTLLNDLDIGNQIWLSIWTNTLIETDNLEHGILNLSEKVEQVLNSIPESMEVPDEIIRQIANSEYADISELKNRAELWKYFQPNIRELFLEATANALVKTISSKGLSDVTIEPELMNHISSDKYMTSLLNTYRSDMNTVLEIYEYIANLKDSLLAEYIKYYPNNLNDVQSARLGNLVLAKRFHLSAKQIFEKAKHNNSFKVALTKCQSIADIGFFDRLIWGRLIGQTVSADSVYSELLRIAVKLYDKGPEDNEIWKRAGGEISKLHNHKTREENWRNAISLLRNGGGGKEISVKSLIKEMIEDHPNNTELKEIKKYFNR
ncbi:effector-associated domain EAD1-containing protein [Sphingobacterium daejeonense]|uniref:GAP1-N1 domain-containing protein n=1 Tax=Sphingobacterium daejeonense TaxID=371142 RepID=UPI0021A801AB|nr:effector-associated domain EAD1-containing protein [Sphingobacterium daejeonense]MCT1531315.1 effector-associated domain EAD1-containing protein [Sphingobacterium daejeonense]